ncbi:hypothetical protein BJ508DRAFT_327409 [Ascobolus immersus RN42]|uniref:Uncharacterized protein n=1 Tax=Ascobolus immersus RN42 TaxID=1160509 RepID=A0A3N4I2H6_ASCIM|nr:hypothetical protein BJ508DRAFT_327409 [Ascobolus immersus RN42]
MRELFRLLQCFARNAIITKIIHPRIERAKAHSDKLEADLEKTLERLQNLGFDLSSKELNHTAYASSVFKFGFSDANAKRLFRRHFWGTINFVVLHQTDYRLPFEVWRAWADMKYLEYGNMLIVEYSLPQLRGHVITFERIYGRMVRGGKRKGGGK